MSRLNKLKKPCCVLLTILLFFSLYPYSFALSGIDLSRVKFSSGSKTVELRFGDVCIKGEATQVFPFTETEVNKLVQETLKSMGLTQLDIVDANRAVEKAQKASQFTKEDIQRVKDNIMTSAGVVPKADDVVTVLGWIDKYMSSKSWDDIGTVSVDMGASAMSDQVKETAKGYINETGEIGEDFVKKMEWVNRLDSVIKFCDMLVDENARTEQKWKDIANGANAKRLLNDFYDKLQEKISAYKYKSDQKGWQINFGQAMDERYFTFFGVGGNLQTWSVDMLLEQKTTDSLGSIAGNYEGFYSITASNEMSRFASNIDVAAKKMDPVEQMLKAYENVEGMKAYLSTSSQGSAKIERVISGDCSAVIDEKGNIRLTLNKEDDNTTVKFSNITFDMNLIYENEKTGVALNFAFPFKIGNDKESVTVRISSLGINDLSPDLNVSKKYFGDGGEVNVGWDEKIWEPWDNNQKELVLIGE